MKTFTNTSRAFDFFAAIMEEKGTSGLALIEKPYDVVYDNITYTVTPNPDKSSTTLFFISIKSPANTLWDSDVMAAISMATGQMEWKIDGDMWIFKHSKIKTLLPLAKIVGLTAAVVILAGVTYVAVDKYRNR